MIKFKALFKDIGNDFGDIAVRLFMIKAHFLRKPQNRYQDLYFYF